MKNFLIGLGTVQLASAICLASFFDSAGPSWFEQAVYVVWMVSNIPGLLVVVSATIPSVARGIPFDWFSGAGFLVLIGGSTLFSLAFDWGVWLLVCRSRRHQAVSDAENTTEDGDTCDAMASDSEQPRLGILHLMTLVACVAIQVSLARTFFWLDLWMAQLSRPMFGLWICTQIGQAAAIGGLLLLAARRYRRMPFPRHPGEVLLVLLGIQAAMELASTPLYHFVYQSSQALMSSPTFYHAAEFLQSVLMGALYLLALRRTKVLRWRVLFAIMLAAMVMAAVNEAWSFVLWFSPPRFLSLWLLNISAVILLVVAIKEARLGFRRYPWTHWLGICIGLWNGIAYAVWNLWAALA